MVARALVRAVSALMPTLGPSYRLASVVSRPLVGMSADTARTSACATSGALTWACSEEYKAFD
jgi:hypothetical protein